MHETFTYLPMFCYPEEKNQKYLIFWLPNLEQIVLWHRYIPKQVTTVVCWTETYKTEKNLKFWNTF